MKNCPKTQKLQHGTLDAGLPYIEAHQVHQIEFHDMMLMPNALFEISPTFQELSYVLLNECRYAHEEIEGKEPNTLYNIQLPNSNIGTLKVVASSHCLPYTYLQQNHIFVTVKCYQSVRFFIIRKKGADIRKVNQMVYSSDKIDFLDDQMINIYITANALEDFTFSAPTCNLKFSVHID